MVLEKLARILISVAVVFFNIGIFYLFFALQLLL